MQTGCAAIKAHSDCAALHKNFVHPWSTLLHQYQLTSTTGNNTVVHTVHTVSTDLTFLSMLSDLQFESIQLELFDKRICINLVRKNRNLVLILTESIVQTWKVFCSANFFLFSSNGPIHIFLSFECGQQHRIYAYITYLPYNNYAYYLMSTPYSGIHY